MGLDPETRYIFDDMATVDIGTLILEIEASPIITHIKRITLNYEILEIFFPNALSKLDKYTLEIIILNRTIYPKVTKEKYLSPITNELV